LPPEQTVFDIRDAGSYLGSASKVIMMKRGTYQSKDLATKREVFATIKPDLMDFKIGGILDSHLVLDAFSND
jgi:hypothetical protein